MTSPRKYAGVCIHSHELEPPLMIAVVVMHKIGDVPRIMHYLRQFSPWPSIPGLKDEDNRIRERQISVQDNRRGLHENVTGNGICCARL